MRQFTNFKLFKKVIRKYWKQHARKSYFFHKGKRYISYWTDKIWCYFLVKDPGLLDKPEFIQFFKNEMTLESYLAEKENWKKLLGQEIVATSYHNKQKSYGILDSFVFTNNGVYFGFKNYIAYDGKQSASDKLQIMPIAYQLCEK